MRTTVSRRKPGGNGRRIARPRRRAGQPRLRLTVVRTRRAATGTPACTHRTLGTPPTGPPTCSLHASLHVGVDLGRLALSLACARGCPSDAGAARLQGARHAARSRQRARDTVVRETVNECGPEGAVFVCTELSSILNDLTCPSCESAR